MRRVAQWRRENPAIAPVPPRETLAWTGSGTAAGNLGGLRGAATGAEVFSGTATGRLGGLRGAATGAEVFSGTATGRLGGLVGSAAGTNGDGPPPQQIQVVIWRSRGNPAIHAIRHG